MTLSNRIRHFFHVVSNVRPIVWIGLYVALTPVFALIYWAMPDTQFRIPDGAGTDFGSWLYYSIVTITTLGFGDYTPAHGWAQTVTAVEVMCGLVLLGFFLNAVGSMKSEIDVASEVEKQKALHAAAEKEKLEQSTPALLHNINIFLAFCYAVTTPASKRKSCESFDPDFTIDDMSDMYKPSGLPIDRTKMPAVSRLLKIAAKTSLCLDAFQNRVDLSLWPELLEDCFAFVANAEIFSDADHLNPHVAPAPVAGVTPTQPILELESFIRENSALALKIETTLTKLAGDK
ncbi:MAG: potassium channel family protein [Candidatus Amulumruptor caecigallinarius]|nr:potassium channel family protein [Candidatus Amulumruptor caecigallinarius]MCM1396934.1 potassium channel family protein [Candidatus Amulumruptor caecigallinarius]MCM1454122.1 potassium channel family protein [bacterium]